MVITAIGLLEMNSIAKGIEATDSMVKAAEVTLTFAKAVCPGKFIILIHGDVAAVQASLDAGKEAGAHHVVDSLMIANVHPDLIPAINASLDIGVVQALGVMEFFSIAASVAAADTAAKTADIKLMEVRLGVGIGGKSFVTLCGDVAAVTESVKTGIKEAAADGMLVSWSVIPSPSPDLFYELV